MKKLFISCPMRGRTKEEIDSTFKKMHRIAEAVFGEELEVIPTYIEDNAPKCNREGVWYLGKSIEMMAQADFFIGITGKYAWQFDGCNVEGNVAFCYKIPSYTVDVEFVAPDVIERAKETGTPEYY